MAGFLVVLVGALLVAGVVTMYRLNATPDITGELFGVTVVDDGRTDLVVNVTRDDPATPVYCIVRAQDQTRARSAGARCTSRRPSPAPSRSRPPSPPSRGFTGDVDGCGDDVPEYLRR